MAFTDYLAGYRMETSEELLVEKAALKAQRTIYSQQGMGTKTLARDLRLLEDRLQAVNRVLAERSPPAIVAPTVNYGVGTVDFSQIRR